MGIFWPGWIAGKKSTINIYDWGMVGEMASCATIRMVWRILNDMEDINATCSIWPLLSFKDNGNT